MAVSFVTRKCTQCAGKLQYIKESKLWRCLYCGAEIERQEQYDGLFTIKNVVRQSLLDTAYRRLDSAAKNLLECEKIDSRYIGTLIAKITYDMIRVTTPGACDASDSKAIFTQLKKNYDQLQAISTSVTDEEEALYEFLEESDIFATLVLVYDTLNATKRRDFVAAILDADDVFSKPANNTLLSYALKNGKLELADQVIANKDHLDSQTALSEVLSKYPDIEAKAQAITALLSAGMMKYEDRGILESYLADSQDAVRTKGKAFAAACSHGVRLSLDLLMEHVARKADSDTMLEALTAFCAVRISDEDAVKIVAFAFDCADLEIATKTMDCLKDSDQYVVIPAKLLIAMLANSRISADNKLALLQQAFAFKLDKKSAETVLTNYLCSNTDSPENRQKIIEYLLEQVATIPTVAVENYVLTCSADGERKVMIVRSMFDKSLNIGFFNDLLSKYMRANNDSKEVKSAMVQVLSEKGLKVDPASFLEYICDSKDELPEKMSFIKRMIANGSQLRADAANAYLERTSPEQFSSELFSMIFTQGSTFSAQGIENYLLHFKEREAVKAQNAIMILDRAAGDALSARYQVNHLANRISCNILQAYILTTEDTLLTAEEITSFLIGMKKLKINDEMIVSGSAMKLKKYIAKNKAALSEVANVICENNKVNRMLF